MLKLLRIIIFPISLLYQGLIQIRNWFFNKNFLKSEKVDAKIISVGNLTLGGSGKTPTVLLISQIIKNAGYRLGILSRGYRRNSKGFLLVSDGDKILTDVNTAGDEIYLTAQVLRVPAAVAEKRVYGARKLLDQIALDVIVLDDAFQHRWIKRDLDILTIDQRFLLKVGKIEQVSFPTGEMREPFSSIKRADVVIINQKFSERKEIPERVRHHFEGKTLLRGWYEAKNIVDVKTNKLFGLDEFKGQKSLVVCGIARPYSFLHALELNGIDFTNKLIFNDHKSYNQKEIQSIRKKFYSTNAYSVLTTHKDAVKLIQYSRELDDIDIYYLNMELKIDNEENFSKIIFRTLNNNKNN